LSASLGSSLLILHFCCRHCRLFLCISGEHAPLGQVRRVLRRHVLCFSFRITLDLVGKSVQFLEDSCLVGSSLVSRPLLHRLELLRRQTLLGREHGSLNRQVFTKLGLHALRQCHIIEVLSCSCASHLDFRLHKLCCLLDAQLGLLESRLTFLR